jgi:hypothetical protein
MLDVINILQLRVPTINLVPPSFDDIFMMVMYPYRPLFIGYDERITRKTTLKMRIQRHVSTIRLNAVDENGR